MHSSQIIDLVKKKRKEGDLLAKIGLHLKPNRETVQYMLAKKNNRLKNKVKIICKNDIGAKLRDSG